MADAALLPRLLYSGAMYARVAAAILAAAMMVACSAPPDKERHQAEGALAAARAAGAATYASEELAAAERALAQYDAAVSARDYRLALSLALEARDGAYEAARRAADEQAAARAAAERLTAETARLLADVEAQLAAIPSARAQSAAAVRWRTLRDTATTALQESRSRLDDQDFLGARAAIAPAAEQLRAAMASEAESNRP
jgi:hypothetical protein